MADERLTIWERLQQEDPLHAAPFLAWYSQKYADLFGHATWSTPDGGTAVVTAITRWGVLDHGTNWDDIQQVGPVVKQLKIYRTPDYPTLKSNYPYEQEDPEEDYRFTRLLNDDGLNDRDYRVRKFESDWHSS